MKDTTTRSGMLWEVERILTECYELGTMPQVLLMENVPQVHSVDNLEDFNKWKNRLEELGYKNYFQDLIATDYGIPQTRNRCFMISILGNYNYTFPKPIPLKLKLKDMLENNVSEKYYLSEKMMKYLVSTDNDKYKVNENSLVINREIACSKTTREGCSRSDTSDFICDELPENFNIKNGCKQIYDLNYYNYEQSNRVYSTDYSCPTLRTKSDEAGTIKIKENQVIRKYGLFDKGEKKHQAGSIYDKEGLAPTLDTATGGYRQPMVEERGINNKNLIKTLEENKVNDGDYIDAYNHSVKKGVSGTILTGVDFRNQSFIAIKNNNKKGYLEAHEGDGVDIIGNYSKSNFVQTSIVNKNGSAPTFTENHGQVTAIVEDNKSLYTDVERQLFTEDGNIKRYLGGDKVDEFKEGQMATTTFPNGYGYGPRTHNHSVSLNTIDRPSVKQNLRIRKLTPKECFALMGVKQEDYERCAKNQSDSSLYHLAGDSIVVNVLMAIFKEMIGSDKE